MNTLYCTIALIMTALSLMAATPSKLSDRVQDGQLQRVFNASRDGYELFRRLAKQELPSHLVFASITEAKQSRPHYIATDPRYNTEPPTRPQVTNFKINILKRAAADEIKPHDVINWEELIPSSAWHGPHYTAYQALTEAGFDPFAQEGEIAFRWDALKTGRSQFADLFVVPDGWGAQIESAIVWRSENHALYGKAVLAKDDLATLRMSAGSSNALIKKMAASLLIRHNAASAEDMKAWLRSESSSVDVAVTVQMMLAHDPKLSVLDQSAWMVAEGERLWGGALIGATLVFAQNQTAVTSMMHYHAKLREAKQVHSNEIDALNKTARSQVGYDIIASVGAELIRTDAIRNYPVFSAANQILSATNIVERTALFFEAPPPK